MSRTSLALIGTDEERRPSKVGILASILVHTTLVALLIASREAPSDTRSEPLSYVELAPRMPEPRAPQPTPRSREVIEAPGPAISREPIPNAPLSDATRRASTPDPSGGPETTRPGTGSGLDFTGAPGANTPPASSPSATTPSDQSSEISRQTSAETVLRSRTENEQQSERPPINWRAAIDNAAAPRPASAPGSMGRLGGDQGFAASGPVSFETSWYPWGEYAVTMLRRIRYYWYENMPELIRLGVKGNVTVMFTIQRDGRITDITTLRESGSPPYDFAARKAISLSSPLPPLPEDFPNETERVTIGFFYNMDPPRPSPAGN